MENPYEPNTPAEIAGKNAHDKIISERKIPIRNLAWQGLHEFKLKNNEFFVVCIQSDSYWKPLLDTLLSEKFKHVNTKPIAMGIVKWSFTDDMLRFCPEISDVAELLEAVPPPDIVKLIVLSEHGLTVYGTPAEA